MSWNGSSEVILDGGPSYLLLPANQGVPPMERYLKVDCLPTFYNILPGNPFNIAAEIRLKIGKAG